MPHIFRASIDKGMKFCRSRQNAARDTLVLCRANAKLFIDFKRSTPSVCPMYGKAASELASKIVETRRLIRGWRTIEEKLAREDIAGAIDCSVQFVTYASPDAARELMVLCDELLKLETNLVTEVS